jgi:anti-sigma B factor antagonist
MPVDNAERPAVFTALSRVQDGHAVVELVGELDMDTVAILLDEVGQHLSDGVTAIEIDADALSFIDSAGLHAVLSAQAAAQTAGASFRVIALSAQLVRVVELTGLAALLAV